MEKKLSQKVEKITFPKSILIPSYLWLHRIVQICTFDGNFEVIFTSRMQCNEDKKSLTYLVAIKLLP